MIAFEEPRCGPWIIGAIAVAMLLAIACVLIGRWRTEPAPSSPVQKTIRRADPQRIDPSAAHVPETATAPAADEQNDRVVARIVADGIGADVRREVERVTRPKQAALAMFDDGKRRLACLLVDCPDHFQQLDIGLKAENFAALKSGAFQPPPEPLAQTISIYRSLTKKAMHYRATGEDRLIVLLCPMEEWAALNLEYTGFNPGPLPGTLDPARKPEF